jgi:hypothetical protein
MNNKIDYTSLSNEELENLTEDELDELFEQAPEIKPSKSMSTSQYAKKREKDMEAALNPTSVKEEVFPDSDDEILMYGDTDPDNIEDDPRGEYISEAKTYLMSKENSKDNPNGGWDEEKGLWFPHESFEGGLKTLAYGFKMKDQAEQDYFEKNGMTDEEAIERFDLEFEEHYDRLIKKIPDIEDFPSYLKIPLISEAYRTLILQSPKTLKFINEGNFLEAADEYTKGVKGYDPNDKTGVTERIDELVDALRKYAEELSQ